MSFEDPNPYASPSAASFAPPVVPQTGLPLASLGDRFAGAFIDGLILLPIMFGVGAALGVALVVAGVDPAGREFQLVVGVVGGLMGAGIFLLVNGYLLATRGQTVGKVVMKTKILSNDDTLVPFAPLILRRYVPLWIATSLPTVGSFIGLANALAIFRENRKCIHDEIAGTKVVKLIQ